MADKCYAPVFRPNNIIACLFLRIIYVLAIAGILIATLFLCPLFPTCRCLLKQYRFRIANCTTGNSNPALPI